MTANAQWPLLLIQATACGPGDYLHGIIRKKIGEGPTRECGCRDRINQMNAWGVAGCRAHVEEITEWLVDQAKTHKWVEEDEAGNVCDVTPPLKARLARWAAQKPLGRAGVRMYCRHMALKAIKLAERAASRPARAETQD